MTRRNLILILIPVGLGLLLGILAAVIPDGTRASRGESPGNRNSAAAPVIPSADLSQLRWQDFRGYRLPVSAHDGPYETAGGIASGYSDTPLGALLAIINVGARTAWQFGPAVFQPTIESQVTGTYQQQMLTLDQDTYAADAAQIPDIHAYATIPAFRWEGYTPSDATVELVAAGPDGNGGAFYVATQIQAQRVSGDWRIVAPPGGDWGNAATPIPSLAGYVIFPGQE